jgi:hypothetical protein
MSGEYFVDQKTFPIQDPLHMHLGWLLACPIVILVDVASAPFQKKKKKTIHTLFIFILVDLGFDLGLSK